MAIAAGWKWSSTVLNEGAALGSIFTLFGRWLASKSKAAMTN